MSSLCKFMAYSLVAAFFLVAIIQIIDIIQRLAGGNML